MQFNQTLKLMFYAFRLMPTQKMVYKRKTTVLQEIQQRKSTLLQRNKSKVNIKNKHNVIMWCTRVHNCGRPTRRTTKGDYRPTGGHNSHSTVGW